jgi:hypothetical protein
MFRIQIELRIVIGINKHDTAELNETHTSQKHVRIITV